MTIDVTVKILKSIVVPTVIYRSEPWVLMLERKNGRWKDDEETLEGRGG